VPRSLNTTAAYPLTDNFTSRRICFQMTIPDGDYWREVFVSHVLRLGYWFEYDRDAGRTAAQIADVWKNAFSTIRLGRCGDQVQTRYVYPPWLQGGPGCWTIETAELDGTLNLIQRVDVDYCETGAWRPPDDWIVQPESGGESDVSAVDINNLQQQIDAQQQQIDDLQSVAQILTQQIEDSDAARIASIRWYPVASAAPDGWASIAGQRIVLGSKPLPDAQTLYDRVPASWSDGGDVLLPDYIDILPVSGTADNQNVAFPLADGAAAKYWLYNTQQTGTRNVNAVRGRWMIYIGEAVIA